jgi:hypothetical protein
MVTSDEGTDWPETEHAANQSWAFTALFTIAGMLLIWWAHLQQADIRQIQSVTFEFPQARWILWSLTTISTGMAFGLAVAAGAGWRTRIGLRSLLWALLPHSVVVLHHLWLAGWITMSPVGILEAAFGQGAQVASAMALGGFLAALLAPLLPEREITPILSPEPEDA